jgi:hypothetical protein
MANANAILREIVRANLAGRTTKPMPPPPPKK